MTNKMCVYHINNILICYQNAKMVNDCLFIFVAMINFISFKTFSKKENVDINIHTGVI